MRRAGNVAQTDRGLVVFGHAPVGGQGEGADGEAQRTELLCEARSDKVWRVGERSVHRCGWCGGRWGSGSCGLGGWRRAGGRREWISGGGRRGRGRRRRGRGRRAGGAGRGPQVRGEGGGSRGVEVEEGEGSVVALADAAHGVWGFVRRRKDKRPAQRVQRGAVNVIEGGQRCAGEGGRERGGQQHAAVRQGRVHLRGEGGGGGGSKNRGVGAVLALPSGEHCVERGEEGGEDTGAKSGVSWGGRRVDAIF